MPNWNDTKAAAAAIHGRNGTQISAEEKAKIREDLLRKVAKNSQK
ncbi:hypothetical protein [Streptomyces paludis]|nr:hypothetical protein [Streptomyces paludis]